MIRDKVLTIAIGDQNRHGYTMSARAWASFKLDVREVISRNHGTIVANAQGAGVTSDQPEDIPEVTQVFVVLMPHDSTPLNSLRQQLAAVLRQYDASSACFAYDAEHEPCFAATTDGFRA